jgi:hypothetical protein
MERKQMRRGFEFWNWKPKVKMTRGDAVVSWRIILKLALKYFVRLTGLMWLWTRIRGGLDETVMNLRVP